MTSIEAACPAVGEALRPTASVGTEQSDPTLRLYAICRADLEMSPGKLAAQAGHAYLDAYLAAQRETPGLATAYLEDGHGTKVTLAARSLAQLMAAHDAARAAGIPCALVIDAGHVIPGTPFDGSPIVTALGLGPARRDAVRAITKRFRLVP